MASHSMRRDLNNRIRAYDADRRARLLGGSHARRRIRAKAAKTKRGNILAGIFDRSILLKGWYLEWEYEGRLRHDGLQFFLLHNLPILTRNRAQ